jgi:DNA-binding transcriptional ArsR family regulator
LEVVWVDESQNRPVPVDNDDAFMPRDGLACTFWDTYVLGIDSRHRTQPNPSRTEPYGLDRAFHALADRSRERLAIGPASVSELAGPLQMTLAAVVQHIQVLEASGVVTSEKVGRVRLCRIEPAAMSAVEGWMVERRRAWGARLDRLGEVLREESAKQPNEENI